MPQDGGVDGLQLIEAELVQTEAFVEDLHHLRRVGEVEASEAVVGRVAEIGLWISDGTGEEKSIEENRTEI